MDVGATPLCCRTSRTALCAARHQSAGSCSAHAGPGDANGTCSTVADAITAPSSATSTAREPPVPISMPRTGMTSSFLGPWPRALGLRSVRLPAVTLNRNVLSGEHFVLQRVHGAGRLVDASDELNRSLQ